MICLLYIVQISRSRHTSVCTDRAKFYRSSGNVYRLYRSCEVIVQYDMPVAPVAYRVILEPGIGQFREFESPRVHTRVNSWGLLVAHN